MATYSIFGTALGPTGPVNGAICNAWKAQRFSTAPTQDGAAPSGSADAGPVTSGTTYGGVGAYTIACPTNESYYVAVQYNGHTYWSYVNDLNFSDEATTTVGAGSTGQQIGSLTSNQLSVASNTTLATSGQVTVTASGGQAILGYTGVSGSTFLTGVTLLQGTGTWTVTTGAAVTQIPTLTGVLLARTQYGPSSVDTAALVVSTTGLTAINYSTGGRVSCTFVAPASGAVTVNGQVFVQGGAAAGTSVVLGLVSTTTSPGTVVGVTYLGALTPTATAADNGSLVDFNELITGLTPGTSYTWYIAAMYSGTAPTARAQGSTSATAVPTGAPTMLTITSA